jgi:DNA-binding GntR family transcriptional regulator
MTEHKTKTAFALEALREAIQSGEIQPGERITFASLADRLGMSITPVREAIRILDAEGFISYTPYLGMTVRDLSIRDAEEIYMMRALLEGVAVRQAIPRLTDDIIDRLLVLEKEMRDAFERGDTDQLAGSNARWHSLLYESSQTKYLHEFIMRLWAVFTWDTIWVIPGRTEQSIAQHHEIMEALVVRDAEKACQLMQEHILSGKDSVVEHLRRLGGEPKSQNRPTEPTSRLT